MSELRMVVGGCGRQKQGANFSGFKIWCVLFVFLKLEKPLDIQIQLCQELAVRTRNSNATSVGRLLEHTPKPKSILLAVLLKSRSVCLRGITRRAIRPILRLEPTCGGVVCPDATSSAATAATARLLPSWAAGRLGALWHCTCTPRPPTTDPNRPTTVLWSGPAAKAPVTHTPAR